MPYGTLNAGTITPGSGNTLTISEPVIANKLTATNGVLFGTDTAAANTLDDYETGTWTPALTDGSGNAATLNSSYDLGRYVKIGKMVYLTGLVGSTSISGMTGADQLKLTGLPFTVASGNEGYTGTCFGYGIGLATGTAGYNAGGYVVKENAYFLFTKWDNTGGTGSLTVDQWTADGRVMLNITYISA